LPKHNPFVHTENPFQHYNQNGLETQDSSFSNEGSKEESQKEVFMHTKDSDSFKPEKPQSAQATQVFPRTLLLQNQRIIIDRLESTPQGVFLLKS